MKKQFIYPNSLKKSRDDEPTKTTEETGNPQVVVYPENGPIERPHTGEIC